MNKQDPQEFIALEFYCNNNINNIMFHDPGNREYIFQ